MKVPIQEAGGIDKSYGETCDREAGRDIFDKKAHGINKWGDRKDIQDEGEGGEQGGDKDREDDEGEQEGKGSGKKVNFYFPGLTPFFLLFKQLTLMV